MGRSISRSASTGRFVSSRSAARSPRSTVTQSVPSRAVGYRSAISGRFISKAAAARHPSTSIAEGQ